MVEGYIDVTAMHQCGIENVVASSGTSLTTGQIRLIRRFTSNITVLYDGDSAGIHASLRGIDMLLAEGMNIKVLLLPDGDDPDSFSRKHTAEDFRLYINEHQTDFIEFKTSLLLDGVTDPIKRSEAISSIVRSISVIQNSITRATYISDCSHRLGIDEATLINTMNRFIRNDREEAIKEQKREASRQTATITPDVANITTAPDAESKIEYMITQMVVRYGETIIYKDVEDDEGNKVNLNVAQYISYDLGTDGLYLKNDLYNRILQEAVANSQDEGFKAETFFTHHPDIDISRTATDMAVDRFHLSKSMQVEHDNNSLCNDINHLLYDFRKEYVEKKMKQLQQEISQCGGDSEKMMQLMAEYKELQDLRNIIAKELGSEIII